VSNKPGHRGEREVSRKTIARGMPGRSGVTVVTMLVCFVLFRTRGCGALGARHSLRPLIGGREVQSKTRAKCAAGSRSRILASLRGAERRSNPLSPLFWLWIASLALAMTVVLAV
jgi:hypothetical protein